MIGKKGLPLTRNSRLGPISTFRIGSSFSCPKTAEDRGAASASASAMGNQ